MSINSAKLLFFWDNTKKIIEKCHTNLLFFVFLARITRINTDF